MRQIKQLFEAATKTLIADGFEWPTGNCHVPKKLQAKSMAGAVHAATVARRDVSIASARNAHGPARDDAER